MIASEEFVVGKHKIGWLDSDFKKGFKDTQFESRPYTGKFQKLPRYMSDAEVESELKPGLCELGDVLAFMDNAPEECKDGYVNLFYFPAFVVVVFWDGGAWDVLVWDRGGRGWVAGRRVFLSRN